MKSISDHTSLVISFLRFPLIIGVIIIHSRFNGEMINVENIAFETSFPIYNIISYLFSIIIAGIAVPLFFIFSGLLFFNEITFSKLVYLQKIKKRIRTLLIPYLFWNLFVFLVYIAGHCLLKDIEVVGGNNFDGYGLGNFLSIFWNILGSEGGMRYPICYQFWFIRDLMVIVLLSPLIYFCIKKIGFIFLLIMGIFWFTSCLPIYAGFNITSFFFFSIGAYWGIQKRDFVTDMHCFFPYSLFLYIFIVLYELFCLWFKMPGLSIIHSLGVVVGIVTCITLSSYLVRNADRLICKQMFLLAGSSFFVYAFHGVFLTFIEKISFKMIDTTNEAILVLFYFLYISITVLFGVLVYNVLKRNFPRIINLITGRD